MHRVESKATGSQSVVSVGTATQSLKTPTHNRALDSIFWARSRRNACCVPAPLPAQNGANGSAELFSHELGHVGIGADALDMTLVG